MNKIFESGFEGTLELDDEIICDEDFETIGNSFFERSYFGTRILILVPNFGDEIILAGNMILNLTAAKAEVFVAYTAEKSLSELNVAALQILGVQREKVIFVQDLKQLILELRANVIFCVDCDSNVEHKNLSAAFEKVIGEILNEVADYRPEIYKKLACATALNSPPDFYAPNLLSVRRPKVGTTDNYDFDIIDRANYSWNGRVRFPVPEHCRKPLLKNNPLADAIFAYRKNAWEALRILNSDEIFFERRTDNQAYFAQVSNKAACDFDVVNNICTDKILTFEWAEAVQVRRIVIYGNLRDEMTAKIKIRLEMDNDVDNAGNNLDNVLTLPSKGRPLIIDVKKIFIRRAEIEVLESGNDFGIGEVEFLANVNPIRKIEPFIKLTIGKDFFYVYEVPYEVEKIPISLYKFHVDEPVKITAETGGESILTEIINDNDELILNLGVAKEITLTAEVIGNPNIYDRAVIRRVSDLAQIQLKVWQWLDKMRIRKRLIDG